MLSVIRGITPLVLQDHKPDAARRIGGGVSCSLRMRSSAAVPLTAICTGSAAMSRTICARSLRMDWLNASRSSAVVYKASPSAFLGTFINQPNAALLISGSARISVVDHR